MRRLPLWTLLDTALFAAGLWLVRAMPVAFIGGTYDDFLFARQANALLDGHWLGAFDQLTLSKGCAYPLFLANAALLHVPIMVATQAVYLTGSWLFARVAARLSENRPGGTLCFAILVASPVLLDGSSSMLMRENLYAGLTLLTLATAARALLIPQRNLLWGVAAGLSLGVFWLTREEGLWLLPALGVLALHRILVQRRLAVFPCAATSFAAALLSIASLNQGFYGVLRTNDFQSGPFPEAYAALARIEHDRWQRLIPVPKDARARAYKVSPAALLLRPSLEGDAGRHWEQIGCQNNPIADCHDIQGGWFIWALREAVTSAGFYSSARDADRFYRRLASEIDAACDAGKIACTARPHGYLPPLAHIEPAIVLRNLLTISGDFLPLGRPRPGWAPPTMAREPALSLYRRITPGSAESPAFSFDTSAGYALAGAFASVAPDVTLTIVAAPGSLAQSDLRFTPLPDTPGAAITRHFSARDIRCAFGACSLTVTQAGHDIASWPLTSLVAGTILDNPGLRVAIEQVSPLPARPLPGAGGPQARVAVLLARAMPMLSLVCLPASLVWCAWRCLRALRRRHLDACATLAIATAGAIATRIALLALLDATSIPNQFRYEAPGLVLVPAFIGLMLQSLLSRSRVRPPLENEG